MNKVAVLIVEDEALIRMSAVQMTEDAGFEAVEAANADEAIIMPESRSDIAAVFMLKEKAIPCASHAQFSPRGRKSSAAALSS